MQSAALEKDDGKVNTDGRHITFTNLRFSKDKDAIAEKVQEREILVESLGNPAQGIRWKYVLGRPN